MAVNLSARQFSDEFLLGDVAVALHEAGMPPELLELETTEGMVIQNVDRAARLLEAIKGMGVRLAIDDFGTGYSSLGQLKNFLIVGLWRRYAASTSAHTDAATVGGYARI